MKQADRPAPLGYLASLRSLGDGLLATVQERVELFTVELEEEKFHLIKAIMWISAIFCTGMLAMMFVSLTLVILFWNTARLAVLGGLTAFYVIALVSVIVGFRNFMARQSPSLRVTRDELIEDRACIRNGN
jgi:uncharacterized membrane protein YqjE